MNNKISILFSSKNSISTKFTLFPFWISKNRSKFDFYDDLKSLLFNDKNDTVVLLGKFLMVVEQKDRNLIVDKLRLKYRKFIFFDDLDGSESQFLEFLPFFDLYFKKQLYKNRLDYLQTFYGNKIFTDYYNKKFGVMTNIEDFKISYKKNINDSDINKLKLGWNLGIGHYFSVPILNNTKLFPYIFKYFGPNAIGLTMRKPSFGKVNTPMLNKCQARFEYKESRSIVDFQRKLFLEIIDGNTTFLTGRLPKEKYQLEIKNAKAVLSPFGFGEICFRDFEAILNGSILIKPEMSHLETWPNIYQPNFTYIPISWDGSDLIQKVENILNNEEMIIKIREMAWTELIDSYARLDQKVTQFINEIDSLSLT